MFSNLTSLYQCVLAHHSPSYWELPLSTALPSLLTPLYSGAHGCTACERAKPVAVFTTIFLILSALLYLCDGNSSPGLLHSDVETGSHLWDFNGEYFCIFCALSIALGVNAFFLSSQLIKVYFTHQGVFSGTAQIFTYFSSCNTLTGWLYWSQLRQDNCQVKL